MERLTTRSRFTNEVYLTGKADVCWADRPIEERAFCVGCRRHKGMDRTNCGALMLVDRLAAYEDTGLEPEEVRSQKELFDYLVFDSTPSKDIERFKRLRELAEADREGRCVVLPCKKGDTVWRIVNDATPHITKDRCTDIKIKDGYVWVYLIGDRVMASWNFGELLFLTREEAEAALATDC